LFGTIGILAIALIIVLVVVLGNNKSDNGSVPWTPIVPPSPIPSGDNPYIVETNEDSEYKQSGLLTIKKDRLQKMLQDDPPMPADNDTTSVNRKFVAEGPNNNITQTIYYEFGQTDKSTVYMVLQNN
jgi:hypothetical protein